MPAVGRLAWERIEEAARAVDPAFTGTPLVDSEALAERLGRRLLCKVECVNPIRSFKGRGADFFLHVLEREAGGRYDGPPLVCASAGNFGQGMAWAARRRGLPLTVFAAETANSLKVERMRRLGAAVHLAGSDFDAAKDAARAFAREHDGHFVEDGREPAIAEGAGGIGVELGRAPDPLGTVLVPLGNGALAAGVGTWLRVRSPATRIVAVCAAGAPAMARSLEHGRPISTASVATIADGIAVRVPVPEALDDLRPVLDDVWLVDDAAIVRAMRLLLETLGLVVEPAGAAGVAAVLTHGDRLRPGLAVTILAGGNVAPADVQRWLGSS